MLELLAEIILTALIIGVIGYTWINILAYEEAVSWFVIPVSKFLMKRSDKKIFQKVQKVLFDCEKCLSGQIALWYGIAAGKSLPFIIISIILSIYISTLCKKH